MRIPFINYEEEKKQLLKDVKEIIKEARVFRTTVKPDKTVTSPESHVCVIVGDYAHVEKSFDDKGRYDYRAYYISSTPGTYWDPPDYSEEDIEGENQFEPGGFERLEDAVFAALMFVARDNLANHFEAKWEAEAEPWM